MRSGNRKKYRAVILCCGHMDRGDDAIGPLCAAALEDRHVPTRTMHGDTSELLDAWQSAENVIVVDALSAGGVPPGTLRRMASSDAEFQPEVARCSTQGMGLSQAVRLGRVLKCLPASLVLVGLEGASFDWADTLSPAVAAAMPALVDAVEQEWRRLMPQPQAASKRRSSAA